MSVLQLIVLLLVLVIVRSLLPIKNKIVSLIVSFFLALVLAIQLSSVLLTGKIADYRFYENFNIKDVLSVADFFGKEGIILAFVIALTTVLIHYSGKLVQSRIHKKVIPLSVLLVGLLLMSFNGGILNNAYGTLQLKFAGDASFSDALSSLKIDRETYIEKNEITASKGKNIIVLSLESLEKGYLGEKLKHLTPNLSKLVNENTLLGMEQSPAGGWTSASMYIALTGVPAYFSTHGNSVFQSSHENKLTTLPDVLQNAGYDLQYFIGKKEYSGIDDMLKTHGFTVKSEKDFTSRYAPVAWGIQDMDLFAEFKKELLAKKNSEQPFAFFLSTIGTHFPNGVPDQRIDSLLEPQRSRLELMVSATDYFVGDLLDFLRKENMFANTVFFIYPDHLLMGQNSQVIRDFDERSLYLLTNAMTSKMDYSEDKKISQIDIPKLILEGAEVQHNAKFLTDFISGEDKNAFLRQHAKSLLQLNDAALTTLNLKDGFLVEQNIEDNSFTIKNEEGLVVVQQEIPRIGHCHRILLDGNMRPVENMIIDFTEADSSPSKSATLDVFKTNEQLYVSLNGIKNYGISKKGVADISFGPEDLALFEEANSAGETGIILNSNSWHSRIGSNFIIHGKKEAISRGLTIISFNAQSKTDYKTFDTYGSEADAEEFISTLKILDKNETPYIVLAHDSAAKALEKISDELSEMGLKKLSELESRQAYVMHNLKGGKVEQVHGMSINMQLSYPSNIKNDKLYFSESKTTFEPRVDRYIAHAGGQIDGIKYTNSLEALTYNYAQGFRLFELDISETSDGTFVAAHDWNHWKKEANYQGEVPVSRSEFNKHQIRNKYTTLDISAINQWFSERPDAILVTDKVNSPKEFAQQFVDKKRLVMELFGLKAVEEALQNGVQPLISEKVMGEIKGDVVSYLMENKIEYVGLSRRSISNKSDFLKKCRENDIKVYVYHVNFDKGKDEKYVFDNEIGLVYGMYADKWLSEFWPSQNKE
ncbi:MAG: sulfatase-like hydrolase/transferase [Aurantibacter sp.]